AAIEIVIFVDHGVELAFAANGHEPKLAFDGCLTGGQVMREQNRLATGGGKARLPKGAAGDMELALCGIDLSHRFQPGNDFTDRVADVAGLLHRLPIDRSAIAEHAPGEVGDNLDLAARAFMPRRAAVA